MFLILLALGAIGCGDDGNAAPDAATDEACQTDLDCPRRTFCLFGTCIAGDVDMDGDGIVAISDCDDRDPAINTEYERICDAACGTGVERCVLARWTSCRCPSCVAGASEVCDLLDNDCDGVIDEGISEPVRTFYGDADGDGYGAENAASREACRAPAGFADNNEDCDDIDREVHPGAIERSGDGVDQDCDGTELCFADGDGDGFRTDVGVPSPSIACDDVGLAVASVPAGDCDDADESRHPDAIDVCNDVDDDCDGRLDDEACGLVGDRHDADECIDLGGEPVPVPMGTICRFTASECPADWMAYQNWTTTTPGASTLCSANGVCGTSCQTITTESHEWADATIEMTSGSFLGQWCGPACGAEHCMYRSHTATAVIAQIGCF